MKVRRLDRRWHSSQDKPAGLRRRVFPVSTCSSADLDGTNSPAVAGMHAATNNVATAVIIIVVIVRVGIVSVIVAVGPEAEPYKRTSVKSAAVKSSTVEPTASEA